MSSGDRSNTLPTLRRLSEELPHRYDDRQDTILTNLEEYTIAEAAIKHYEMQSELS